MDGKSDIIIFRIPGSVPRKDVEAVEKEIAGLSGVNQTGSADSRSLDAATIQTWVELAGHVITTAGAAVPVVKQIIDLFRSKNIKGLEIVMPDGMVVKADELDSKDFAQLIKKP